MKRIVLDTNVLIYLEDARELEKQEIARDVLPRLQLRANVFLSAQVASEYANTLLRLGFGHRRVDEAVGQLATAFLIVPVTPDIIRTAIDGVSRFGFAFYDAQIWAAARSWGATLVLSEDFADGLVADGVRFANPFAPGFDLESLLASA